MSAKQRLSIVKPKRLLVELRELCLWIFLTLAVGVIAIYAMLGMKNWDPLNVTIIATESSIWEVFFAVFGLMYAIIVGLFLVEAYRRWQELSSTIQSEINAVSDIHDCLRYFADEDNELVKKDIKNKLIGYVGIVEGDWDKMKNPKENRLIERFKEAGITPTVRDWWKTSRKEYRIERFKYEDEGICSIIEDMGKLKLKPGDLKSQHALELIIDRTCEITTHRVNRLELAEHGLTLSLYVLIIFMSVVIVVATLLLDVPNDRVHGFIVFSTTVALVALGLLLADMDHPFIGFWRIWTSPLDDIKEKLRSERS